MKNILIIGAGKSSSYLIKYLLEKSNNESLRLMIGDICTENADLMIQDHKNANIYLAGEFNQWGKAKKPLRYDSEKKLHTATILLPKGRHEYKFIIDGKWCVDPACPCWILNHDGIMNSVIDVK